MSFGIYISHPEVNIEPHIPVEQWGLSEVGRTRALSFAAKNLLDKSIPIYSSTEQKALDLAHILSITTQSQIIAREDLGENDRSSTGYLTQKQFEIHVKHFFGKPEESFSGWETAKNAQIRIAGAVENILEAHNSKNPIVICGHGGVGTLLKCHMGERSITQSEDQGATAHPGGGNIFVFNLAQKELLCDWTPMEHWTGLET